MVQIAIIQLKMCDVPTIFCSISISASDSISRINTNPHFSFGFNLMTYRPCFGYRFFILLARIIILNTSLNYNLVQTNRTLFQKKSNQKSQFLIDPQVRITCAYTYADTYAEYLLTLSLIKLIQRNKF